MKKKGESVLIRLALLMYCFDHILTDIYDQEISSVINKYLQ